MGQCLPEGSARRSCIFQHPPPWASRQPRMIRPREKENHLPARQSSCRRRGARQSGAFQHLHDGPCADQGCSARAKLKSIGWLDGVISTSGGARQSCSTPHPNICLAHLDGLRLAEPLVHRARQRPPRPVAATRPTPDLPQPSPSSGPPTTPRAPATPLVGRAMPASPASFNKSRSPAIRLIAMWRPDAGATRGHGGQIPPEGALGNTAPLNTLHRSPRAPRRLPPMRRPLPVDRGRRLGCSMRRWTS